jgi:deferrochelatase/peroxidase EfeB
VTYQLDLLDIQGNVLRAYGRFRYPAARYVFFNIRDGAKGRAFVAALTRRVTTAVQWGEGPDKLPPPEWTLNVAFNYQGLKELDLPRESLIGFSPEFVAGMKDRKDILGDDGPSAPEHWDPIWQHNRETREHDVHIFVSINGLMPLPKDAKPAAVQAAVNDAKARVEAGYRWLLEQVAAQQGGVALLGGHRGDNGELLDYQDVQAVLENGVPTSKEHFGYTDGIGDPVFEGVPYDAERINGRGKQLANGQWAPLAAGEFLLGHTDEALEYPPAPSPLLLARNGTYMIYRKLHENVGTFERYLDEHGQRYPGGKELLAAKFVGRWRDNGAPIVKAWDDASKARFDADYKAADGHGKDQLLSNFTYDEDMSGGRCPFSAHIRRINPRASLEFTRDEQDPAKVCGAFSVSEGAFDTPGALANRRRVLRRGLPYGTVKDRSRDDGNHGIIIMMLNADINRQFEFVQQQWINYGNDFKAGNDKEILLGNHSQSEHFPSKAVLQVDPASDDAPYILPRLPRFVETRGGEYFFVPSLTALRMIAAGTVDPT